MGLIWNIKPQEAKCHVYDLSRTLDNQNLLNYHLHDMLRDTRRVVRFQSSVQSPQSELPSPVPANTLAQFEDFDHIPLDDTIDLESVIDIYERQYNLVDDALEEGAARREQFRSSYSPHLPNVAQDENVRAWRVLYDRINSGRNLHREVEERYESALSNANKRLTPNEFAFMVKSVLDSCEEGDLIDISGYRGTGYYFVGENKLLIKTLGQFGCHLPPEAWHTVSKYSCDYFEKADIWGCYLPVGTHVHIPSTGKRMVVGAHDKILYSWLIRTETLEIDGQDNQIKGEIWDMNSLGQNRSA